jgi:hypothetical protein
MKKNYIAPSTETATWASMGLMQDIAFATNSASGGGTTPATLNDVNLID